MNSEDNHPAPTLFSPHGDLIRLEVHLGNIPRYLFRTTSPKSAGRTTDTFFEPGATAYNIGQKDLLSRSWEEAVDMLESHLQWQGGSMASSLTSWTNSFFFAAQHAIRRQATDRPSSDPASIHITVLDTRSVPRGTFLPAVALLQAYEVEDRGKLQRKYYHGEYLSQGRVYSTKIFRTTLQKLITHGLYKLYPPFAEVSERKWLCIRVLYLRRTIVGPQVEVSQVTDEEIKLAQKISRLCFSDDHIRPVFMMTLLSLRRRDCLDPRILEAFRDNGWGVRMLHDTPESYGTTTPHVPEHEQFVEMANAIHKHMDSARQRKHPMHDAASPQKESSDPADLLKQLHITDNPPDAHPSGPDAPSGSQGKDDDLSLQGTVQHTNAEPSTKPTHCVSPKTMMIEMMQEEREEQETAIFQIEDCFEENRPCPECAKRIGETCFRRQHFTWCTLHQRMLDENGTCPGNAWGSGQPDKVQCTEVICDQTEEEAYWEEVERNAILGGAGFREPGEPYIH